jgi:hypothetical protein
VKVIRTSPLTGKVNEMEIPCTQEQLDEFHNRKPGQPFRLIQQIFPNLNATQREFIMTGYTQEDWDKMFPPEEQEDDAQGDEL